MIFMHQDSTIQKNKRFNSSDLNKIMIPNATVIAFQFMTFTFPLIADHKSFLAPTN